MPDRASLLAELYEELYSTTAASANGSRVERLLHRRMERDLGPDVYFPRVLELGANRGEHLAYVRHKFDHYVVTDLRPMELSPGVRLDPRVNAARCDAAAIPAIDCSYDRVIATCLLHHVESPLQVAQEMRRIARPGGRITILVPTDPGLAYRVGQALTSGRSAAKRNLSARWRLLHAVDHLNHFRSIRLQLDHVFAADAVRIDWFPLTLPLVELNPFTVWQIDRGADHCKP